MVKVANTLEEAHRILGGEKFHFATIDLQLDKHTLRDEEYEGWNVLQKIIDVGLKRMMRILVISGYPGKEGKNIRRALSEYGVKFIYKPEFDEDEFIDMVIKSVDRTDVRFKDDYRDPSPR